MRGLAAVPVMAMRAHILGGRSGTGPSHPSLQAADLPPGCHFPSPRWVPWGRSLPHRQRPPCLSPYRQRGPRLWHPPAETRTRSQPTWPSGRRNWAQRPRASWWPWRAYPAALHGPEPAGARGSCKNLLRPPASFFSHIFLPGRSTPPRPSSGGAPAEQTSAPPLLLASGPAIGCELGGTNRRRALHRKGRG